MIVIYVDSNIFKLLYVCMLFTYIYTFHFIYTRYTYYVINIDTNTDIFHINYFLLI